MSIHGVYHLGNDRVACRNVFCTVCHQPRLAEGRKSIVILHIGFIPFAPIGTTTRWICRTCQKEADSRQPSRKGILVAGVLFGIFMTGIGLVEMINKGTWKSGSEVMAMGFVVTLGLTAMIRKQNHAAYVVAHQTVVPLAGDHCWYDPE